MGIIEQHKIYLCRDIHKKMHFSFLSAHENHKKIQYSKFIADLKLVS